MQRDAYALFVEILVKVVDAIGVEQRGATLDAVNQISLAKQKLGEISTILARNSRD